MISAADFQKALQLECLVPSPRENWDISSPDVNRPGMQLCGYYEYFAYERPQVLGKMEMTYLEELSPENRSRILERFFAYRPPCVVICRNITPPSELVETAAHFQVHVFRSPLVTTRFCSRAMNYLNRSLAPHIVRHGVLLDIFGVGVMLTGRSGVGKSEAALELIKRGHQLVADDVVDICRIADDRLIGTAPDKIRHYMEIRGLGLVDVRALYGIGAVSASKTIDLVIELEHWDSSKTYDRIGVNEKTIDILGVQIPWQIMPIGPGRNLAILVEVAARNYSLKKAGYHPAREFLNNLHELGILDE